MFELCTFTLSHIDSGNVHLNIYVFLDCIFFAGPIV